MAEVNDPIDPIDPVDLGNNPDNVPVYSEEDIETFNRLGIDPDNFLPSDLKKIAQRVVNSENTLVALKKKAKTETTSESWEFITKADLALEKFLDKNPELAEYTKELWDYQKKGLSLEEAKTLILNSDKARVNREKVNSLGLSDWETSKERSTITKAELGKIAESNPKEYNRLRDLMDAGKLSMR